MSQENVEVVRRWYASAPDLRDTDLQDDRAFADRAFRDYLDERVELRLSERYPEGEMVFQGREGFAAFLAMLRDTWAEWRFEPERILDAGDRIVVFVRVVGKSQCQRFADRRPDRPRRGRP
jgi:ketosteroid isomerase-like protein